MLNDCVLGFPFIVRNRLVANKPRHGGVLPNLLAQPKTCRRLSRSMSLILKPSQSMPGSWPCRALTVVLLIVFSVLADEAFLIGAFANDSIVVTIDHPWRRLLGISPASGDCVPRGKSWRIRLAGAVDDDDFAQHRPDQGDVLDRHQVIGHRPPRVHPRWSPNKARHIVPKTSSELGSHFG